MACSFRHNNAKSIWEMTREQTWRKSRHPSSPPTPRLLKPFVSLIAFNLLAPCDKLSIVPFSTINSFRFGRGNSLRPNELLKIKIKINVSRLIIVLFSNVSSRVVRSMFFVNVCKRFAFLGRYSSKKAIIESNRIII